MPAETITRLAATLRTAVCDCASEQCALEFSAPALCRTLLHLLAEGQPISVERLADTIGQPATKVASMIHHSTNVEFDEEGNIVGTGITLRPTQHRMSVKGRTLYTWCALDTLMYAPLLEAKAEIASPCAATGALIQVIVSPLEVESVTPDSAVVSIVVPSSRLNIRQSFCNYVHFFSSAEEASTWLRQHPGAVVLTVSDAYELGKQLTANYKPMG